MRRLSSYAFLLGLVLFILLLRMVDVSATARLLISANPIWVIASFFFLLPEIIFKGFRIAAMSRSFHSRLSVKNAIWLYLAGQPLSALTPAKLGDIIRVLGIIRWGSLRPHSAFAVHVADKIFDIVVLGLLTAMGLISLILQNQHQAPAEAALLGIALGILLMMLFLNPRWMGYFLKPLLLYLAPQRLAEKVRAHGREFYQDLLGLFQLPRIPLPFFFSLMAWFAVLIRAYFSARALGLPLSFTFIALHLPIVIMIEFIPITLLGFGTREASLLLFFSSAQIPNSGLFSFSFMLVLAGPLCTSLLGIPFAMKLSSSIGDKS